MYRITSVNTMQMRMSVDSVTARRRVHRRWYALTNREVTGSEVLELRNQIGILNYARNNRTTFKLLPLVNYHGL